MMKVLIAAAVLIGAGFALGSIQSAVRIRWLRKRVKELRGSSHPPNVIRSVTRFLFVTTQVFAIGWVSWSYVIATYSTVVLLQPFPVEELSRQAITTLLGMSGLKVVENIFEHNEGVVFGTSASQGETTEDDTEGKG